MGLCYMHVDDGWSWKLQVMIPGVMSFGAAAPHINLLLALCSRHCGDASIFRSRDVDDALEKGKGREEATLV